MWKRLLFWIIIRMIIQQGLHMNIFKLQEVGLPNRVSPRATHLRQEKYDELFDNETLIYDIVYNDEKLVFITPPLTKENINAILENSILNGDALLNYNPKIYNTNRIHKIIIEIDRILDLIVFNKLIDAYTFLKNQTHDTSRLLYTMQKNNSFQWIKDWVDYYHIWHNPSLIVIYDNNSSKYTIRELQKFLDLNTNSKCIVKSFPFKYGPGAHNGSSWDSDYCQYAGFEHIRNSLIKPRYLLNVDIDEILITKGNISIFELISKSDKTNLLFKGRWVFVDNANYLENLSIKHVSHTLVDKTPKCPNKYIVNLEALDDRHFLGVHEVVNINNHEMSETSEYLHFRNISDNWKYNRSNGVNYDNSIYDKINLSHFFESTPNP